MEKRVVIGGSRDYSEYNNFKLRVTEILIKEASGCNITVLSGHCRGVDLMAEKLADELGCCLEIYPPDWHKYGKGAGVVRNREMVNSCDIVIAFWDGKSKGTHNLITLAEKLSKHVIICKI